MKEEFEFENRILEKILPTFSSANVWGHDGFQLHIINVLRDTIKATVKELNI